MRYVLLITDISYLYGRSFLVNEYSLIKKKKKEAFYQENKCQKVITVGAKVR